MRCPYCLQTPLRKPGSWFEFKDGCPRCNYRYEREDGYFSGAPWMVTYPILAVAVLSIVIGFSSDLGLGSFKLMGAIALVAVMIGLGLYPFSRAIWMVLDHLLHPLQDKDQLQSQSK